MILGRWMGRRAWIFILLWSVLVLAGVVWSRLAEPIHPRDVESFLPPHVSHNQARELMAEAFPKLAARSQIAVIAYRPEGLGVEDFAWLDRIARQGAPLAEGRVLSPTVFFLRPRLVSPDGQAALVVFNLSSNFLSNISKQAVERIENLTRQDRPSGLTVEITGTAAAGRDYGRASEAALRNTTWVTIAAVLFILVVVYRSPFGPLVPLMSIGASVFLAFVLLGLLERAGWMVSDLERIFAVVLLFGAGVNYTLFWISAYGEVLQEVPDYEAACASATRQTGPAILASAATTICGLTTLMATNLVPTQNAGKLLGIVLALALLASLTLSPALARQMGPWLFWPRRLRPRPTYGQRVVWPRLARTVTQYPQPVLGIGLLFLATLAASAFLTKPRYDALNEMPPGSSSERGYKIAARFFSKGQLYANTLLLEFPQATIGMDELERFSRILAEGIAALPGVDEVYSLDHPLGRRSSVVLGGMTGPLQMLTRNLYWSNEAPVMRFEILIDPLPFTPEAMSLIERVEKLARQRIADWDTDHKPIRVLCGGPTAYVLSVREVVNRDQVRVMILASMIIAFIVFLMIRDLPLTLFMLLATWLTFGACLALSEFFFVRVLGEGGLDYKVRIIVFVIVVAVGQDYNLFLISRLMREPAELEDREATRRAIVRTGSVISSCGLIMAATLGSLGAGGLTLLRQVGFTLATGVLIDTFFVRPLLVPSFFLIARRRGVLFRKAPLLIPAPDERRSRK